MIKRFPIISFVTNPHTPGCSLNWHLSSHIFLLKFVFFLFQIGNWRSYNILRWKLHYSKLWVFHILFIICKKKSYQVKLRSEYRVTMHGIRITTYIFLLAISLENVRIMVLHSSLPQILYFYDPILHLCYLFLYLSPKPDKFCSLLSSTSLVF